MKIEITQTMLIEKSPSEIFKIISDLSKWTLWSPWYHTETASKTHVSQNTHSNDFLTWEGQVIGSGKMSLTKKSSPNEVEFLLEFFKPFKNKANVIFKITEKSQSQSIVSWNMTCNFPWFMYFFKGFLVASLQDDFLRGLLMLKELSEKGSVTSRTVFHESKNFPERYFVGIKVTGKISDLGINMQAAHKKIADTISTGKLKSSPLKGTVLKKFIRHKNQCELYTGLFYDNKIDFEIPEGFSSDKVPAHKAAYVDFFGSYMHIRNGWSVLTATTRARQIRHNKALPEYELYIKQDGPESELHTQMVMPILN